MRLDYSLGELFCGPGGMGYGATRAQIEHNDELVGIRHTWATDIDKDACLTYVKNISRCDESVLNEDVRKLDVSQLSPIDILAFGFPCNDFSVVGERLGLEGNFGPLYSYGVHVVDQLEPLAFVAENVGGLSSANDGATLHKILEELGQSGRGYELTAHLYKAEQYGVPQRRHRILIVGIRSDVGFRFNVPAPTHEKSISCRSAIEEPPIPLSAKNNEKTRMAKQVVERLSHIRPGENAFTADLPSHLRLNVKGATISQIYKRLDPDLPSYTVTGSGGGGTHVYHWSESRALTNRERARLQTFPDEFVFCGSKESVRRQIGMAVPPRLANVVFTALLKCLKGIEYESVRENIEFLSPLQGRLALERVHSYG